MKKVFIDSSLFLAACRSKTGGASNIFMRCRKKEIQGYISRYVIYEVKKNSFILNQTEKSRLNFLLLQCNLKIVSEPSDAEINEAAKIIARKDASILAVVIKNKIDYLITLDKKDFMSVEVRKTGTGIIIVTPNKFIGIIET